MASPDKRLIMLIELPANARERIEPLVSRSEHETVEPTAPAQIAGLLQERTFDLIIVGYPPQSLDLDGLVRIIRHEDGASRQAGVLLIGENVPDLPPKGVNQVASLSAPDVDVTEKASLLLRVDPRASVRILVKLEVSVDFGGKAQFVAQSVDISRSGMLIRSTRRPAIGEQLPISIQATGTTGTVKALAEVVRYADPARENVTGFAVRFLEMDQLSEQRLEKIVQRELSNA